MKKYCLFIDESGSFDLNHSNSELYILCGCAVEERNRQDIKAYADQIKFKYWGKTDIVFHSREMSRNDGAFEIFEDKADLKELFLQDLLKFLRNSPFTILPIIIHKPSAKKKNWTKEKIIQKTSNYVISNYIRLLFIKKNAAGKIVIEFSNTFKDKFYLESFNYFIRPDCKDLDQIDYKIVQKKLTSLSFVTKHNHDIEEQIADLMTYPIKCKYQKLTNKSKKFEDYGNKMMRVLESKLLIKPNKPNKKKKPFFDKIESFGVMP